MAMLSTACKTSKKGGGEVPVKDTVALHIPGKFHPGHYVYIYDAGVSLSTIQGYESQAIVGVNRRYWWRDLEKQAGVYDFSAIASDLADAKRYGKQLIALIADKSSTAKSACPAYLDDIQTATSVGGMVPFRWTDEYITAFTALMNAIGNQFDSDPNFEGVGLQETALSLSNNVLAQLPSKYAYSDQKYSDAIVKYVSATAKAMPNSRVFWLMNYLGGGTPIPASIPQALVPYLVVMGGPDILPWRTTLNSQIYPLYDQFYGKLPLCCSMQEDSFHTNQFDVTNTNPHSHSDEGGYASMEDLLIFGRDRLHLNYIIWSYKYVDGPGYPGANTWDDALAAINKYPVL